ERAEEDFVGALGGAGAGGRGRSAHRIWWARYFGAASGAGARGGDLAHPAGGTGSLVRAAIAGADSPLYARAVAARDRAGHGGAIPSVPGVLAAPGRGISRRRAARRRGGVGAARGV